jgi:hypothetical protein
MSKQGSYGGYSRHDNPYAQQDTYNPYGGSQPGAYDDSYDRPNQGYDQPGVGGTALSIFFNLLDCSINI